MSLRVKRNNPVENHIEKQTTKAFGFAMIMTSIYCFCSNLKSSGSFQLLGSLG
jgi:hypothetical protein